MTLTSLYRTLPLEVGQAEETEAVAASTAQRSEMKRAMKEERVGF
ncbi:hypothetical protein L914_08467 [Phytophthora nicotianae]|nr:hypothetical protein L914_08467 [Phytophthora nicotianae]